MNYVTYENYRNRHVIIHKIGCSEPHKRGGVDGYNEFESFSEVEKYAISTNLPLRYCEKCKVNMNC